MILAHLPALQVAVPLISAPLCAMLNRPMLAWALALFASWVSFGIAILLLLQIRAHGVISYAMGGWTPPYGIEYRIDALSSFVLAVVAGMAAILLPYAKVSVAAEIAERNQSLFYTALMLNLSGLLGVTITGDAFNLFVFLEIASLSSYILVASGGRRDRRAFTAAYTYLVMGTVGATFYVIGVGLLYMMTGSLNFRDLASLVPSLIANRTILVAFAFLTVGLSLKLALFPLHLWLPNAYAYASSTASALLATTSTKVAGYAVLRIVFTLFGPALSFGHYHMERLVLPLALICMVVPSVVAVFQDNAKRMLAYSSVGQIGYMALGVGLASSVGLTATIVHLLNHALAKGALFMALGCVMLRTGSVSIAGMAGLGRRMPWTMAAFVLAALSLIGIPATAGFVSKWYFVIAALQAGHWSIAAVVVGVSLIAVLYLWRVVEAAYFAPAPADSGIREAPAWMLAPLWLLVAANFYFGLHARLTVELAEAASRALYGLGR